MRAVIVILASIFAFAAQATPEPSAPFISPPLEQTKTLKTGSLTQPGYCELEIINSSYISTYVDIVYDTFQVKSGFRIEPGYSLLIPLNYGGGCHRAAYALVYSPTAQIIYKDYGYKDQVLEVYSSFDSALKVKKIEKK